jgi:AraC-like DNA-binding protein
VNYTELPAPAPLDELVHCFWFLSGDDLGADAQTIVPDGRLEIILHLAEPFARLGDDGVGRTQAPVLLSGQLTQPIYLRPRGVTDIVGIRLRTAVASAVITTPLSALTNHVGPLSEFDAPLADALLHAATRSPLPETRARLLADTLSRFVRRPADHLVRATVAALEMTFPAPLGHIARELGVSTRTVERRVIDATGLPPSTLRRVLRFRRAFPQLDQAPAGRWAQVASRAGYYDQAHLIRDFRQFTGAPPRVFLSAEPALARAILGRDGEG